MEEDETFDSFYARFSNLTYTYYNLGQLINEEKKFEIQVFLYYSRKVTAIENFNKPIYLKIHELIDDLQSFKIQNLIPKGWKVAARKGKILTFNSNMG